MSSLVSPSRGGLLVGRLMVVAVAAAAASAGAVAAMVALSGSAASATEDQDEQPPPRMVILARSDNPVDALASGPVGGALGAPVLLTPPSRLHPATAEALVAHQPDLVVLAGGTAALSGAVEQAVADLGFTTRRAAGADRHETAVLVSALLTEWLTPDDRLATLEATLAGVTREAVDGHDTIRFDGVNLQLRNGTGGTAGEPNGLGNLIIGYNAPPFQDGDRTGSHYLIVGDRHNWSAYGGIVAGDGNSASAPWASVTGGGRNIASGSWSTVTGGRGNIASHEYASVSGGELNRASGFVASVSGGGENTASGGVASVSGGAGNVASGNYASVSGGGANTASGLTSSILGGSNRTVDTTRGCHPTC